MYFSNSVSVPFSVFCNISCCKTKRFHSKSSGFCWLVSQNFPHHPVGETFGGLPFCRKEIVRINVKEIGIHSCTEIHSPVQRA